MSSGAQYWSGDALVADPQSSTRPAFALQARGYGVAGVLDGPSRSICEGWRGRRVPMKPRGQAIFRTGLGKTPDSGAAVSVEP